MSQIYRNMNKVGKFTFWQGTLFSLGGLALVLTNYQGMETLGACALAIGLYNIAMASYDERCNIKNNSKGEPLVSSLEKKQTTKV
jgi:hypothetical protein